MATVSPCVKVCRYEGGPLCVGCKRTVDEISDWWRLSDEDALAIMAELPNRQVPPDEAG